MYTIILHLFSIVLHMMGDRDHVIHEFFCYNLINLFISYTNFYYTPILTFPLFLAIIGRVIQCQGLYPFLLNIHLLTCHLFQIKSRPNGPMMTMDVSKTEATKPTSSGSPQECAGCCKPITERYLLKALEMYWHEDCLKCGCCDCRLGEVGSTLYTKANLILCKRDYLRLFGNTGYCAACSKVIPAFEMVMRARSNVYHLECFACQQCNHR